MAVAIVALVLATAGVHPMGASAAFSPPAEAVSVVGRAAHHLVWENVNFQVCGKSSSRFGRGDSRCDSMHILVLLQVYFLNSIVSLY